jgi:ribosomal protein S18 acetylase RimI-like enzyme
MLGVRRATAADVPTLRAVAHAAYEHYVPRIGRPPAPMTADYAAAVEAGHVQLAVDGAQILGFAVVIPRPDHVLLDNLAVLPSAQGRGIGTRLLALAEQTARHHGVSEVRLYTNEAMTENLGYYARRGYVETRRAEEDGYRRVHFRKPIG